MTLRWGKARSVLNALILSALTGFLHGARVLAEGTICAEVRLEIKQEATLEREAFDAMLEVTNQYPSLGLTEFRVNVIIKDPQGRSADNFFFVKISSKEAINAVDGTGIVQPASTATIHWLIIPSTGAGGSNPLGLTYSVKADISYKLNGNLQTISTFEDNIIVRPQPALKLEYVLPFEVFADEALTEAVIEPVEPFPLGVRITNAGYGPARNFQINSGQPEIIENKQGLAIDFKLLGTYVGDKKIPDTLLIPFGDIPASGVSQAAWIMATSLSGRFTKFDASFTHAAELGGQLTSLIQGVTTYTLVKDMLVDLPGRDGQFDFLVNTTTPRAQMESLLNAGLEVVPEVILESDQAAPIQVTRLASALKGNLNGSNTSAELRLTEGAGSNLWVFTSIPAPLDGKAKLVSAVREDGKNINPKNIWISKHFNKNDSAVTYRLNLIDYNPPSLARYTLNFSRESLDAAPAPITDLSAFAMSLGGQAGLNWSATGEDGNTGTIIGGRYLIQAATSPTSEFSPALAQMNITTNTAPGSMQTYFVKDLAGNASYYLKLWLQDTGGAISGMSNGATTYVLPNPPTDLVVGAISSTTVGVSWDGGNNVLPIEYGVWADSDSALPAVSAAPFKDPFDREFTFEGLTPNTTYFFYGLAKDPVGGAYSQQVYLGQALTHAAAPGLLVSSQVYASSFTVVWDGGGNPAGIEYFVQLSTAQDWSVLAGESGWLVQSAYTFNGLNSDTTYYIRAKARNSAGAETAYADLGIIKTQAVDILAPVTTISFGVPSFGAEPVYVSSLTELSLAAYDDTGVAGDRLGAVTTIYYTVDSDTFTVYAGSFSIIAGGGHVLRYYSADAAGNIEAIKTSSVMVDDAAPLTLFEVAGSSLAIDGRLYVHSGSSVTLSPSDAASGVKALYYSLDGSTAAAVSSLALPVSTGAHVLSFYAVDNLNNPESEKSVVFFVDAEVPVTTTTVAGLMGANGWHVSPVSFTLISTDAMSGIETVFYSLENVISDSERVLLSSGAYFEPLTVSSEGIYAYAYHAADRAGNVEIEQTGSFKIDITAPESTVTVSGVYEGGYYTSSVTVTITAVDALSGVQEKECSLDNAAFAACTDFAISTDGAHTVLFRAKDKAGNQENDKTLLIDIRTAPPDIVPPTVTASINGLVIADGAAVIIASTDTITLAAADEGTPLPAIYYSVDTAFSTTTAYTVPFTLEPGTHTMHYGARDNAGNVAVKSVNSTVTPPNDMMPYGYLRKIAGTGAYGYSGDGGDALNAVLGGIRGSVFDKSGNLIISDSGFHVVRKLTPDGKVFTIAGTGAAGFSGDGGPAVAAQLNMARDVAIDSLGNIYIADMENNRVRKIDAVTGNISTIVENLYYPNSLGIDKTNNLYVYDYSRKLYKILPDGQKQELAAISAQISAADGIAFDAQNNLYIADTYNKKILKVDAISGIITTVAGGGALITDNAPALQKDLGYVLDVEIDKEGNLYVSNGFNLYRVTKETGLVGTIGGGGYLNITSTPMPAAFASLSYNPCFSLDGAGGIYLVVGGIISKASLTGITGSSDGSMKLYSSGGGISVSTKSADSPEAAAFIAAASRKGLISAGGVYAISPSGGALFPPGSVWFKYDPQVVADTSTLAIYTYDGVSLSSSPDASGLRGQQTLPLNPYYNIGLIAAEVRRMPSLAGPLIVVVDKVPPRSELAVGTPAFGPAPVFVSPETVFTLTSRDDLKTAGDFKGFGVVRNTIRIKKNGQISREIYSDNPAPVPGEVFISTFSLGLVDSGIYTIEYYSTDVSGNAAVVKVATVTLDSIAPSAELALEGPVEPTGDGFNSLSGYNVRITSTDTISGVANIKYLVDITTETCNWVLPAISTAPTGTCLNPVYSGPFTLPIGTHTIYYGAVDNVGNQALVKSVFVNVERYKYADPAQWPYFEYLGGFGAYGTGPGYFKTLRGLNFDSTGNIWAADQTAGKIEIFTPSGEYLRTYTTGLRSVTEFSICPDGTFWALAPLGTGYTPGLKKFSGAGSLIREIEIASYGMPRFVACDKGNNPFVAVYNMAGTKVLNFDVAGNSLGEFPVNVSYSGYQGMAFDVNGDILVLDYSASPDLKMKKFSRAGSLLASIPLISSAASSISLDSYGNIYIPNSSYSSMDIYSSTGGLIGTFGDLPTGRQMRLIGQPLYAGVQPYTGRLYVGTASEIKIYGPDHTPPQFIPEILSPANGAVVYTTTPYITGSADAMSQIAAYDGFMLLGKTQADQYGDFLFNKAGFSTGRHSLRLQSYDSAGNVSLFSSDRDITIKVMNLVEFSTPVWGPGASEVGYTIVDTSAAALGDFDRDGKLDVVGFSRNAKYSFYKGEGDGRFKYIYSLTIPGMASQYSGGDDALSADFNNDGFLDVAASVYSPVYPYSGSTLVLLYGNGDGTFQTPVAIDHLLGYAGIAKGDFNNDGYMDLASASGSNIKIYLGDPVSLFVSISTSIPAELPPSSGGGIEMSDIDGDGKTDIIFRNAVLFSDGLGGFDSKVVLPYIYTYTADIRRKAQVSDFNQDGRKDILFIAPDEALSFLNLGNRAFIMAHRQPKIGISFYGGASADLNNDGTTDIALSPYRLQNIYVLTGHGDGTFAEPVALPTGGYSQYGHLSGTILAEDINGDGRSDIFQASSELGLAGGQEINTFFAFINKTAAPDIIPPATVSISAENTEAGEVTLSWVAPGNDGNAGIALRYDLRYKITPIFSDSDFNNAQNISNIASPRAPGSTERFTLSTLTGGTSYYFALKTYDNAGNVSTLSNSPGVFTKYIVKTTNIIDGNPEIGMVSPVQPYIMQISTASGAGAVAIGSASMQSLTMASNMYEIKPEGEYEPPATLTFHYSTAALTAVGLTEADAAVYEYFSGTGWVKLEGQILDTLNHRITVPITRIASLFGIFGVVTDKTAPVSEFLVTGSSWTIPGGGLYINAQASIALNAFDPVVYGTSSGVAFTEFRVDAASITPFALYSGAFNLSSGPHSVEFHSRDNAGNIEAIKTLSVTVDDSPPLVTVDFTGIVYSTGGVFYIPVASTAMLRASDAGSGVKELYYGLKDSTYSIASGSTTLALAEGGNSLAYSAADNVGNISGIQISSITVDAVAPLSVFEVVGSSLEVNGRLYILGGSSLILSASDFFSGIKEIRYSLDGSTAVGGSPLSLMAGPGEHTLSFYSIDNVENAELEKSVTFFMDALAPVTSLSFAGASFGSDPVYVSTSTGILFNSTDSAASAGDGLGAVAAIYYAVNSDTFTAYSGGFSIPAGGVYTLKYYGVDAAGNTEAVRISSVSVDGGKPLTRSYLNGVQIPPGGSALFIKPGAAISLGAVDDPVNGAASGVGLTTFSLAEFSSSDWVTIASGIYSGAFVLGEEGSYRIDYQSFDNAGNIETPKSLFPTVDGTAPVTFVEIKGVQPAGNAAVYMTAADTVTFVSTDAISGAASTYYTIDLEFSTMTAAVYAAPFTLSTGTHTLYYLSVDKAGNGETVKTLAVTVDTLAPYTGVYVDNVLTSSATGPGYPRPGSSVTLIASETLQNGFASGVAYTLYEISESVSGAWVELASGTYSVPLVFNNAGSYRLSYRSGDRAGNEELEKEIYLEVLPPLTAEHLLDIGGYGTGAGKLNVPYGVASDRWGTGLYVADSLNFRVQKFDYDGKFLFEFGRAGSGPGEFGGPVQATEGPGGDAAGGRNQLFVADPGNYRIQIFTNAGEYQDSFGSRGGGPGQFESLYWVAATDPGNFVFTSDEALNRVQQFTIGGGYMGEIGAGLLSAPRGLALDVSGLYVVDSGNRRVAVFNTNTRELTASWPLPSAEGAGIHVSAYNRAYVSDLAGRIHIYEKTGKYLGSIGGQGNDPLEFSRPLGLATDRAGLLYVADSLNDRVQKLKVHTEDVEIPSTPGNLVSKYTSPYYADLEFTASGDDGGTGQAAWYEVKISPTGPVDTEEAFAAARLAKAPHLPAAGGSTQSLTAVGLAGGGRWHIGVRAWDESGNRSGITAIALDTSENVREGDLIRYAGLPVVPGFGGRNENWPATLSQISVAKAVGVGKAGALYIAQGGGGTGVVKVVAYADNNITREAGLRGGGGYNGDGIPAPTALLNDPTGVTADGGGNIYLSDTLNNRIRKVDAASGLINTVAGNGTAGYSGDGGPAAAAALNKPRRLSFDRLGNIYFADTGNNRVRRVEAATGIITTIAGNGTAGYAGDGGSAAQSALNTPSDAEADSRGNVYIADTGNNRVRRIDAAGNIATVAGGGTGGDGGQAAEAALSEPADVSVDPLGNIYIAERSASKVRRIGVDGVITTVAGTGVKGTLGVNGPVNTAQLSWPGGVAGDWERGRLYISEDARVTALGMAPFLTALSTATPGGASEVTIISTAAYNMVPVAQLDISTLIAVAAASEEVPVSAFYEINTVVKAAEAAVAVRVLKAGVNDASALALYRFNGVDWDSSTVVGQYMADMAGYYEAGGTTKLAGLFGVFETRRDYVAPVTGFTIEGAAYLKEDGALYLGAGAAIKLTASDEGTGVLSTEYRLEVATAGSFALISSGTYGAPLSPGVDGEYLISWHSADHVGNVELEQSTRVYVDGTAPTTVFEVAGSTLVVTGGFYILDGSSLTLSKAGAEISLGAVDDPVNGIASGVALTTYTFAKLISSDWVTLATGTGSGPFMMSEEGSYRIDYQSIDNVGNIETPKSLFPTVDGTAPATYVEIKGVRPAGNATVYMTGADTVAFIAADSVSGAASTYYTIDLEFSTTTAAVYTGPFTLAMGTHTLYYMSVDKVGNSETVRVLTVAVDTLAPFTSVYVNETLTSSAAGTGYMRPGSSVTLIASETLENGFASGVAYTLYALSKSVSGAWVELASGTYSAPFMFNDTGSYRLSYRSGDRAGNEEPEKEIYLEALPPLTVEHLLDIGGYGTGAGKLNVPYGVASDRWGTGLYVADSLNFRVQKFDYDGKFLFEFGRAGSGPGEFGGPVQAVEGPGGDATGIRNQLYVADPGNYRVQIFSSDGGYLNSFGSRGSGPGQFEALYWVASEESSSFIFAGDESLNRVQQFNVGGAYMGEIGAGILSAPRGIAFDASGLYVVDSGNRRVAVFNTNTRELTASWPLPSAEGAGIHVSVYNRVYVSDLAGRIHVYEKTGKYLGFVGGPGSDPLEFNRPLGLATDRAGLLYVADSLNDRVQKIKVHTEDIEVPSTPGSLVSKYTAPYYADLGFTASGDDGGTGQAAWYEVKISSLGPVDTEEAFAAAELSKAPHLTAVGGSAQNLTATGLGGGLRWHVGVRAWDESGNRSGITAITLDTSESVREGDLIYYAGLPAVPGFGGRKDNWPATLSQIGTAKAVGVGKAGTLLIAQGALGLQGGTGMIRAVAYADNNITRAAGRLSGGGYSPDGIPAVGMLLNSPAGVAADNGGNIYLSDTLNNRIRKVDAASGLINTVAGNGTAGYAGDGGPAAAAALNKPRGLSLDRSGNIYFADTGNNRVRRVDAATGMITTIAGNGTAGYSGDGGPAATALLNAPGDAEADGRGNVYIADTGNNRVRLIDAAGNITTIAGGGTAGDGAPAAEAALSEPTDVSVDPLGNVYVAERSANKVRRISVDGIINTAAGTGVKGTLGMNGPVDAAQLSWPGGVAGDWERGRLYISEDARVTALGMAPFFTSRSTATAQGESEVTVISTAAYNILPVAELDISTLIAVAAASEEVLVGAVHEISSVEKGAEAAIALRVLKTGVNDASALALYRFNGVDWDSSTIAGQYVADRGEYYEAGGTTKFAALFGVFETRPDHVPPVTGFNIEGVSYLKEDGAHYLSPSAAVKLTASDAGTGVSSTEYRLDVSSAGSFALVSSGTYGAPLGPGIDGEYLVSWHSADHVGNVELEQSTRVYVDGTAPVTAFEVAGSSLVIDGRLYILDGSSLTLSASDAFSGVKETYYALDGSTAAAVSPPVLPVSAGEHTLIFHTVDNLGNMESEKSLIFFVDAEAPVTTAAVAGLMGGNGWHVSPVSLTLVSTDAMSGVETVFYSLEKVISDSGRLLVSSGAYPGPLLAGSEGIYAYSYYSADRAGNPETQKTGSFKIDISSPSLIAFSTPAANTNGWNNTAVTAIFSGTDSASGIAFCTPDTQLSLEGSSIAVNGYCSDYAGLASAASLTVNIDTTAPAIGISSPAAGRIFVATRGGIYLGFGINDNLDPAPAFEAFLVQTDDKGSPLGDRPAVIAVADGQSIEPLDIDDGIWRLTVSATDFADNTNTLSGGAFEVVHDVLAPRTAQTITGGASLADGATTYITSATELKLASADDLVEPGDAAGLGVKNQAIQLKAAGLTVKELAFENPEPKQGTVFVSTFTAAALGLPDGIYSFGYRAGDILENREAEKTFTLGLDNTAPETTAGLTGTAGENGWHISSVAVKLAAADALSGVEGIYYQLELNGQKSETRNYTEPFTAGVDGAYSVYFYAKDKLGNTETEKVIAFKIDLAAPVSAHGTSGIIYSSGTGKTYLNPASGIFLNAADPVSGGTASGIDTVEYYVDSEPFIVYTASFSLTEGIRTVNYRSRDKAGNTEAVSSAAFLVDGTAPATTFNISGPLYIKDGVRYITPESGLIFTAADPLSSEVAAGVEYVETEIDSGQWLKYTQALKFAEGRHIIKYRAIDNVGNVEAERSLEVQCDNTAPVSKWSVSSGERIELGNKFYLNVLGRIALESADPPVYNVASGLENIYYGIDAAPATKYTSVLGLVEGARILNYKAKDNVGNTEVVKSTVIYVDGTKPVTELTVSGDQYQSDRQYISQRTDIVIAAVDPVVNEVSVGVKETKYAVDGGGFGDYSQFKLSTEGKRVVSFYSADHVNNVEATKTTELWVDATTPLTTINIIGGRQYAGTEPGSFYASLATEYAFTAVDPVSAGGAAGVKNIEFTDNGGALKVHSQPIALGEGKHTITYRATDRVENIEVFRSTQVYVDNTAPVTVFNISEPLYIKDGVRYITPASGLTFTAADPLANAVAAGVERIETAIDGGQWLKYTQALKFAEGRHTIKYRTIDNVGNMEAERVLEVQSDATAPESRWLAPSGDRIEKGGKFHLNALGSIALESSDPVVGAVASGVEGIYYGIDAAAANKYAAPFGLTEGIRTINFSAKDNVDNTEVAKSTAIYVDGTKPLTALSLSGDQSHSDKQYISQRTDIIITALDPVVSEVAVGVKTTGYRVEGIGYSNEESAYTSPFKLNSEGKHIISFYSTDYVNNAESVKTAELWADNTAPATALTISGVRYSAPGEEKIHLTKDSAIVLTPADPLSNDTASGVMLTKYRIDGGNWQVYLGSFTIAVEGLHTLEYYSLDRVQNAEALKSVIIAVDNTPPATGINLGEPRSEVIGLPVLMPNTPITLTAADPVMNGVAAGLNSIFYEIENVQTGARAPVEAYTSPFTIPEQGTFIVRYWSKDNVNNTEAAKVKMAAVSTWRADGLIAASGLDMSGTADIAGAVKSNVVVSLGGNARILGDVTASTITLSGKAEITGMKVSGATPVNPAPLYLAGLTQSAAAINNNALAAAYLVDGKLVLGSQAGITLTTGTYYFKGLELGGGSSITIAGKVDILVEGGVTINGGSSLNASGPASGLSIIVSTSSELKFNGGAALAACLYAPYSDMKLTGNALLGGHYFVKTAAVSGTGNLLQSGEALPAAAVPAGGGPKTKASAMPTGSAGVLAGPDPAFRLGEVYVFPNPAKGNEAPVFHIETGIADSVKITIYTISGRAAHEQTLTGLPVELDDGNGLSYAYEYVWRGHIPTGVYLYSIEAQKAGQKLKKTGKFGVVR